MADAYEKLKVPELKQLLKDRGVSSTGATRKAQYIAKLIEHDVQAGTENGPTDEQNASADDVTITEDTQPVEHSPSTSYPKAGSTTSSNTLPADEALLPNNVPEIASQPISAPAEESLVPPVPEPAVQTTSESVVEPSVEATPAVASETVSEPPVAFTQNGIPKSTPAALNAESSLTTPVPTQETLEDNRKRKRRSLTPPVHSDEMAIKKQKHEEEVDPDVSFTEAPTAGIQAGATPVDEVTSAPSNEVKSEEQITQDTRKPEESTELTEQTPASVSPPPRKQSIAAKDVRYKSLFNAGGTEEPTMHTPTDGSGDLPPPEDAMHPTTRALYIRNFQRPILVNNIRNYLISIARTAESTDGTDIIETIHLDGVRTHAFVLFTDAVCAVRAREALHNRVWPAERDRKPLWVDFIPEDKVQEWIDVETKDDGGGKTGGRRWEVAYEKDEEGRTKVSLVEFDANRRSSQQVPARSIPTGPRSMNAPPARPASRGASGANHVPVASRGPNTDLSFEKLGTLFASTTAKPKIYWQVVDPKIAADRKAELEKQTSRDWNIKDWDNNDLMRFSFENRDELVHSGKHIMTGRVRAREEHILSGRSGPPPSESRGRGGYRGGGYRGSYRGGHSDYRGGGGRSYRP